MHVVAGHVFDHFAATFDDTAITGDKMHPQQPITRCARAMAEWTTETASQQTTDGGVAVLGRIPWQPLTINRQNILDVAEHHPRPHRNREVRRDIVAYHIEGPHINDGAVGVGGVADNLMQTGTTWHNRSGGITHHTG